MSTEPDPVFREACVAALHDVLNQHAPVSPDVVGLALDALLPVLASYIKPHRWDQDYPESAAPTCRRHSPDTFYGGVLHAVSVVRDLLPPKVRETPPRHLLTEDEAPATKPSSAPTQEA